MMASSPSSFITVGPSTAKRAVVPEFGQVPTEIWERIFLFMGVAGVAKMRTLSTTCARIGSSVLERGGTITTSFDAIITVHPVEPIVNMKKVERPEEKKREKTMMKEKVVEEKKVADEDEDEDEARLTALVKREKQKRRRGEGLWEPHMRDSILARARTATIDQWAALSRNKRLWRSVRGCPATKRRLLQALQDFFHVDEASGMWHSLFRSSDKEKKVRLPSIKSLQTVLDVCKSPALLDVILEMPMSFIAKCLHLLKGAKASRGDFAVIGQLALSRSLPGGIVAECGELLANGGLSRGAGVKDIGVVLALKHRWCEDWLIDTLKRLVPKADVDMVSQIAYHEGMVPTQSAELHAAIKKRLVGILATANFQDVQYLKDCQFEFEGWKSQEAIGERLEQLVKQHAYSLGHFNCSWLWRQNGTGGQQGQRGRDTTNIHPHAIRRRPTPVEKQFDRFLVAKRSAEAAAQGSASASNSTVEQTHCAAGMTGRKESFLSPSFLYWAPPNRRTAHRWAAKSVNPQKHFAKAIERLTPDDAFDSLHPAKGMGSCSVERMVALLYRGLVSKPIVDKLCEFMRTCATVDLENLCCDSSLVRLTPVFHELVDRLVAALTTFETLELVVRLRQSWVECVLDAAPGGLLARRVLERLDLSYHIANADATCMVALLASPRLYGFVRCKRRHMGEAAVALKRLISTMVNVEELVCLLVRPEVARAVRELDSDQCRLVQAVDEKLTIHLVPLASTTCLRLLHNLVLSSSSSPGPDSDDAALPPIVKMSDDLRAAMLHRLFMLIAECRSLDDLNDIVGEYDPDSPRLAGDDAPLRHLAFFNERERDALWGEMMAESRALQESIMAALENVASAGMPRRDLRRLPNCPWMWHQVNEREPLKFFLLQQSLLAIDDDAAPASPTAPTPPLTLFADS
ncbi:uncharacterized protein ACA1_033560 [Acanthamoeba castellanii str. Neff]|uniref:Uncharacterized protein n=1 Tax=Acanthamoeba castellanii (strain ATCC 30010 / Neff) TaxID=1257118 RepID=L8GHI7_ACACF|nr:uncharacterized protein ACA1_033560 [Acanthamoeba castellanii str. Neff]ELR12208.1 hypothetical protein ACA1_033560 [Acanthamoeba castellanii str. Neff]